MTKTKEELLPFKDDIRGGALYFGKSERTIRRWLIKANILKLQPKYSPGKIDKNKALEIRELEKTTDLTQAEIAKKFNISQTMVGKIINNQSHSQNLKMGGESEIKVSFSEN